MSTIIGNIAPGASPSQEDFRVFETLDGDEGLNAYLQSPRAKAGQTIKLKDAITDEYNSYIIQGSNGAYTYTPIFNDVLTKGKNLISLTNRRATVQGVTYEIIDNKITATGENTSQDKNSILVINFNPAIELEAGETGNNYTFSISQVLDSKLFNGSVFFYYGDNSSFVDRSPSVQLNGNGTTKRTLTVDSKKFVTRMDIVVPKRAAVNASFYLQIEQGNEKTDYTFPYKFKGDLIPDTIAKKSYVDEELDSLSDTIQEELSGKEDKTNKVARITDGGTADQYPTVAAVKNYRNELLDKSRKNLIAFTNVPETDSQGVTFSINDNWIAVSGTAKATTNANLVIDFNPQIELEAGAYTASIRDEEGTPSNVMIYFYIQGSDKIAFQINGSTTKKIKYEPAETVFIRRVIIGVGAKKTAGTAFHLQLEKGDEASDYEPPYKIKNSLIPDNIPDKAYVKKAVNNMNYIYVSNDYDESTEGFGKIYFNSIIAANDSITDNSKENPYTIIVKSGTTAKPCVYDEFEDLYGDEFDKQYGGNTDEIPLQGIRTKNYVYYESETPDNPSACKLKWDGVEGYLKWDGDKDYKKGELTNELAIKKCIFHLANDINNPGGGMHTHIKGFTIESKNTRYGIHMESGGYGRNREWIVENCIIEYGGRPDVYKGDVTPIIGMGMSPHEKGTIRNVKAFFSDDFKSGERALNCHDNYETTVYKNTPAVKAGAKLTIDNCDFGGYAIGLSKDNTQRTDPVSDTPFNAYLINNVNVSETVVTSGNWQAKGESVLVSGE